MSGTDLLFFVEDPGAANIVIGLPDALAACGLTCVLTASGKAVRYLRERGETVLELTETPGALLDRLTPAAVAVGTAENPLTPGLSLVTLARARAIPTLGLVDSRTNAAFRFRGRSDAPLAHAPEHLAVPDAATREAYLALGYPAAAVHVCGHPHYDRLRRQAAIFAATGKAPLRREVLPQAPDGQAVVVFAAEISCGLDPDQYQKSGAYTLEGRGISSGRTEIVLEEFLLAADKLVRRPYLVLRLHPKQEPGALGPLAKAFDAISVGGDPSRLVYAADLVVGMTSMLLAEAALLGVPTLSIVPREAEHAWLPSVIAATTPCVWTRPGVQETLAALLDQTAPPSLPEITSGAGECLVALLADLTTRGGGHDG